MTAPRFGVILGRTVLPGVLMTTWSNDSASAARGGTRLPRAHVVLTASISAAVLTLVIVGAATTNVPVLVATVALAPAAAVGLYRLLTRRMVEVYRLALTDSLTGLGNSRHFLERLERDLDRADSEGEPLTLVMIDIDDFKAVNDRFGHPVGDGVLSAVASSLRRGGEAFRLGGDEFALLLPGKNDTDGLAIAETVIARIRVGDFPHGGEVTASAGTVTYPGSSVERGALVRTADAALYHAKHNGKDCARAYRGDLPDIPDAQSRERANRLALLRAAASLASAVAASGLETHHGRRVGDIAARMAARMGLGAEHIELIRLAGCVSDVGKLALPDDVLRKPGPLTEAERRAVQRHPEIGYAMLDSLGADPVATWVRHHHERWDGRGYPERLAGERIPLGARILFVADAFDAMTNDQAWRPAMATNEALTELRRCAGTQFDPDVVEALLAEMAAQQPPVGAAA